MDDFSSLMAEDDQGVEKPKPCRHDNKHVDGGGAVQMVVQEGAPGREGDLLPPWHIYLPTVAWLTAAFGAN